MNCEPSSTEEKDVSFGVSHPGLVSPHLLSFTFVTCKVGVMTAPTAGSAWRGAMSPGPRGPMADHLVAVINTDPAAQVSGPSLPCPSLRSGGH